MRCGYGRILREWGWGTPMWGSRIADRTGKARIRYAEDMTEEELDILLGGHRLIRFLFAFSLGCVTGVFWREVFRLAARWL